MKSSYSEPQENCVDVTFESTDGVGTVVVADDKNDPDGPQLRFSHDEWNAFLLGVKAGEFDIRATDGAESQEATEARHRAEAAEGQTLPEDVDPATVEG